MQGLMTRFVSYSFKCNIDLSEPIDVYTDWIDECEAAQNEDNA